MFNEKHVSEFTELKAEMFNKTFKSRVGAKFEVLGAFTQKKFLPLFLFHGRTMSPISERHFFAMEGLSLQ